MTILWVKQSNGTFHRGRTALRKVTNRFMKRKLWFSGTSIKAY